MKNLKVNRPRYIWKSIVLPGIICFFMLLIMLLGVTKFSEMSVEQDMELTLQAVRKAAVQCYADEGRFPANVEYLVRNYNINIDYDRFHVNYDCAAANVMPNITVFKNRSSDEQVE